MSERSNIKRPLVSESTGIQNFDFYKQIGTGSFGYVYLAKNKITDAIVAIKQLEKNDLIKKNKIEAVMREKEIL